MQIMFRHCRGQGRELLLSTTGTRRSKRHAFWWVASMLASSLWQAREGRVLLGGNPFLCLGQVCRFPGLTIMFKIP